MYDLLSELDNPAIRDNLLQADEALNRIILMIQGLFFEIDCKAFANFRLTNLTLNEKGYTFFWHSISESSTCPRCGTESNSKRGFSRERKVVGEAILGKSVKHKLKKRIFICKACKSQGNPTNFTEDTSEICGPRRKTTRGLDEKIINDGISRSANGLAKDYFGEINVSRKTS